MIPPHRFLPAFACVFFLVLNCGNAKKENAVDVTEPKALSIKFDKVVPLDASDCFGTTEYRKYGDYLVMLDHHVDALKISCMHYPTSKIVWTATGKADDFYFHNNLLVISFRDRLEIREIASGKVQWQLPNASIWYNTYATNNTLGKTVSVAYHDSDLLDLDTRQFIPNKLPLIPVRHFLVTSDSTAGSEWISLPDIYKLPGKILYSAEIDKGTSCRVFIWTLDREKRLFKLTSFDERGQKQNEASWEMPEAKYDDEHRPGFTGLPSPDNLSPQLFFINNRLILYENYSSYRWSWGRGDNRLTSVSWEKGTIDYQVWGQSPTQDAFEGFLFFDHLALLSDGVMDYQFSAGIYKTVNLENGKSGDTLLHRFSLFRDYRPELLIGFNYEYQRDSSTAVSMQLWNYKTNSFSKSFQFNPGKQDVFEPFVSDDGTVILPYYNRKLNQTFLYCCKISED